MQKLSHMNGLFAKGPSFALVQLDVVASHAHTYLRGLAAKGLHIIHTIRWFTVAEGSGCGITSVEFRTMSKTEATVSNCRRDHDNPVLLIFGMGGSRPMPLIQMEWSREFATWVRLAASFSTLCLSKDSFLKAYLLERLSAINTQTTVIPRRPRDDDEENIIYLTTYAKTPQRRRSLSAWKLRSAHYTPEFLEYYHDFKTERKYLKKYRGDSEDNTICSLVCEFLPPSEKL